MKRPPRRSTGVSTALATASEAPDLTRGAFEEFYRASRDDVYAYAAGLLRDHSAAEEVTAQTFERAWRRRRQLNPRRGTPRAWLFGIARNAALDELRRRSRAARLPEHEGRAPDWLAEPGPDPSDAALDRTVLRRALETLTGRERELIALKFFAGLSNAEIATVVRTSESNAGTRLHRAIEKLRRSFDDAD